VISFADSRSAGVARSLNIAIDTHCCSRWKAQSQCCSISTCRTGLRRTQSWIAAGDFYLFPKPWAKIRRRIKFGPDHAALEGLAQSGQPMKADRFLRSELRCRPIIAANGAMGRMPGRDLSIIFSRLRHCLEPGAQNLANAIIELIRANTNAPRVR